jgi:hypothetical protein
MKKIMVVAALVLSGINTVLSQIDVGFGGTLYLAPQYWSKIGVKDDPKFGIGFGALGGIGIAIDQTDKMVFGPHVAVSRWNADYSGKANSATSSVYVEMTELGAGMLAVFDDIYLTAAMGRAVIGSGMTVDGKEIKYEYDGDKYTYYHVGLGYKMDLLMFGLGFVSYSGYARYCNHAEFRVGIGF